MDIDLYHSLIRRFWGLLIGIGLVATIGAAAFTLTRTSSYEGSVYFSVAQAPQAAGSKTDYYQFGDYYALQGSNYLADYFKGWLKDPATIEQILVKSGGGLPANKSLTSISRYFSVKPLGTVGLQVFHTTSNHDETNRVLTALQTVLTEKLSALQSQGLYPDFRVVPGSVLVHELKPDPLMAGAIGFGAGVVLAVLTLLILAATVPERR